MALRAFDVIPDQEKYAPRASLEPFYILAAAQLGDPDQTCMWMTHFADKFYDLLSTWIGDDVVSQKYMQPGEVLLQYIIWYEQNRPTVDTSSIPVQD